MLTVADLLGQLARWYPPSTAEPWDAVGTVCGDPARPAGRVLLSVDVTSAVVAEAIDLGADLLIAHHPLLLRGVHGIDVAHPKGRMVHDLIGAGIVLHCAHTNADSGPQGTVETLAAALGLEDLRPLRPVARAGSEDRDRGLGRVGTIRPTTVGAFAEQVARTLPSTITGVRLAGDPGRGVHRVALQAGAGDDLFEAARESGAEIYLTSDLRHHPVSEAIAWPDAPAILEVSHWAAEWMWLPRLQDMLHTSFDDLQVTVSTLRTDPWDRLVGAEGTD